MGGWSPAVYANLIDHEDVKGDHYPDYQRKRMGSENQNIHVTFILLDALLIENSLHEKTEEA